MSEAAGIAIARHQQRRSSESSAFKEAAGGDAVDVDLGENATLVRMFLSGKTSAGLGNVGSSQNSEEPNGAADQDAAHIEYFPDPPCIGAVEQDDQDGCFSSEAKSPTPQHYWKDHVCWKRDDPAIQAWVKTIDRFRAQWDKQTAAFSATRFSQGMKRSVIRSSVNDSGETIIIQAFVNINASSVGIRSAGSHEDSKKIGQYISPGEPVVIERVMIEKDSVRFLKLADDRGWVFDSKDDIDVMAKMEDLEVGTAWYRVVCKELIDVRRTPIYDISSKTGRLLCPREVVAANMRCRVRGDHFVHLADGRGWVFVLKQGASRRNPRADEMVLEECEAEFDKTVSLDYLNFLPPTTHVVESGKWTYVAGYEPILAIGTRPHGTHICPGDVVLVNMRSFANGDAPSPHSSKSSKMWLRLNDGRGWVPETGLDGKSLMTLREDNSITYPKHYKGKTRDFDKPSLPWMAGVA